MDHQHHYANASLVPVPHLPHMHHGVPILETDLAPAERAWWTQYAASPTYFTTPSNHRAFLYAHIILGLTAVVFIYPIVLALSSARRPRAYLVALFVNSALVFLSMISYATFIRSVPELYPGLAYPKMLAIVAASTAIHMALAAYTVVKRESRLQQFVIQESLESEPQVSSLESINAERVFFGRKQEGREAKLIRSRMAGLNTVLDWAHFGFYLVLVPTAIAMFCVLGQGNKVFGLLAHFIKGGVFFAYGILTLSRYCGAFADRGWAWNQAISYKATSAMPGFVSMEMVESGLILFYGCTNIFLERLAANGPWNAKDLQHALIAFIFIGCGLSGVIVDLQLGSWRRSQVVAMGQGVENGSPGYLPNPFPAMTIVCTGIIMSKHHQSSVLATEIHILWGTLLVIACAFRGITYMAMPMLSASLPLLPKRPMLELVTSFCLLAGGLIFMESTETVVHIFEFYGLTPMFILNVLIGLVALLMSWIMLVFAFRNFL